MTTTIVLAILALASFAIWTLLKNDQFQLFGEMIHRIDTNERVIALTFDDGPTPERTQEILNILYEEDVKATFFLVGRSLKKHPEESQLLINSGHEIGNHSLTHSRMVFISYSAVAQELQTTDKLIRNFGYEAPIHFRPPYGKKLFNLPLYLYNNDIKTITWDVEPETWGEIPASVDERVTRALDGTKPGSIILMHVMHGGDESMRAVTPIIRQLKSKGYQFVTVSELLRQRKS